MAKKSERKNRSARKRLQIKEALEKERKRKDEEIYKKIERNAMVLLFAAPISVILLAMACLGVA